MTTIAVRLRTLLASFTLEGVQDLQEIPALLACILQHDCHMWSSGHIRPVGVLYQLVSSF
jgi:hypothetical protein